MRRWIALVLLPLALTCVFACNETATKVTEPEWSANVKDTDTCQPVREQKVGGVIIFCKAKCPSERSTCGTLQARKRATENPWTANDGSVYDASLEYRCVCR